MACREEELAPGPVIHLSLERLVDFVAGRSFRRAAHDLFTLRMNPRSFRLAWLPSLAAELLRVGLALAGMASFDLGHRWRHRR
jgi:hypothetical protein